MVSWHGLVSLEQERIEIQLKGERQVGRRGYEITEASRGLVPNWPEALWHLTDLANEVFG